MSITLTMSVKKTLSPRKGASGRTTVRTRDFSTNYVVARVGYSLGFGVLYQYIATSFSSEDYNSGSVCNLQERKLDVPSGTLDAMKQSFILSRLDRIGSSLSIPYVERNRSSEATDEN